MRKSIIVQFLIALILLAAWSFGIVVSQQYMNTIYGNLYKYPILVYSYDFDRLNRLKVDLDKVTFITEITLEKSADLSAALQKKYQLDNAQEILQNSPLPNLLVIRYEGSNRQQLQGIIFQINSYDKTMLLEYRESAWDEIFNNAYDFKQKADLFLWLWVAFSLFFLIISRIKYENINYPKFADPSNRTRSYILRYGVNTLMLNVIPFIFVYLGYNLYLSITNLRFLIPENEITKQIIVYLIAVILPFFIVKLRHD